MPLRTDADTWAEIEKVARECQRTWGMGFPVISIALLESILDGAAAEPQPRDLKTRLLEIPCEYLHHTDLEWHHHNKPCPLKARLSREDFPAKSE